jgi:hypothetical protein
MLTPRRPIMATVPEPLRKNRDPVDDARARSWARETREKGDEGSLPDESDYLTDKLAEEKSRLNRS